MIFNFHKEDSLVSQYSSFLYNADNSRFIDLNKGTTKKAVKSTLGYETVSDVGDRGKTYVVESGGSSNTSAHQAYSASKDNYINAAKNHQYITTSQISDMGSYVSSNYSGVSSVWDFLKARGLSLPTSGSNTNILITKSDTSEDTNTVDGKKDGEYTEYKTASVHGYKYNDSSLSPGKVSIYQLVTQRVKDVNYQSRTYSHYYWSTVEEPVRSKPLRVFYFAEDSFKNVLTFSFDPNTNLLSVRGRATGATGRQTVRIQYREDSDDAWTTCYSPKATLTLKGGYDYEVRVIVSDEAGHKETTDTFYCTTSLSVDYIDADGQEKTAIANPISDSSTTLYDGWYVVKSDVTIDSRITCRGFVHLILCDGGKLTATNGISVNEGEATLTIYGQKEGTGKVEAGNPNGSHATIGGDGGKNNGLITINGGSITAIGIYAVQVSAADKDTAVSQKL